MTFSEAMFLAITSACEKLDNLTVSGKQFKLAMLQSVIRVARTLISMALVVRYTISLIFCNPSGRKLSHVFPVWDTGWAESPWTTFQI